LIIEINGSIHNQQIEYDIIREEILKEMGNKMIRFTNDEVLNDWASAAQKLRKFLE
jgi:very-short-patch-repair endonuclease